MKYLFVVALLIAGTAMAQTWQPGYEFPQFTDAEKVILARSCVCGEPLLVKHRLADQEGAEQMSVDALTGAFGFTSDNARTVTHQARTDLALKKWSLTDCIKINERSQRLGNRFSELMSKKMGMP
jgi:hypothetical protein